MLYLYLTMGIAIGVSLSIVIGLIFSSIQDCRGVLKIDRSEEKDLYRFEIDDLDDLLKKRRVVIKIDKKEGIREKNN